MSDSAARDDTGRNRPQHHAFFDASPLDKSASTDVCILVEGCYPFISGGVSSWIDWLIRSQPHLSFSVVALWPRPSAVLSKYQRPENLKTFSTVYLQDFGTYPGNLLAIPRSTHALAEAMRDFLTLGGRQSLAEFHARLGETRRRVPLERLFNSPIGWQLAQDMYDEEMPYGSFLHFFWAWRGLLGGLLATFESRLPKARVYHTISTGYAGVLAARAALETGRPALLTEHGIYTNERRIELLMADWVADTVDKGHALEDPRLDLRDMWVMAFEAYARTCYETATRVVTLYADNQRVQAALGASKDRLQVIPNGIDVKRFADVGRPGPDDPPTIALIGRVVPIKDVKCFITVAGILKAEVPGLRALIMGPTDEDAAYVAECRALVASMGLEDVVTFTGPVNVAQSLSQVHVVVLTSLSESQPLVVLEAGAAGIPFVATDVGSCREIIEGRPGETPALGPGGIVTSLVAPAQIAASVAGLLADPDLQRRMGNALRERVRTSYTSERASGAYTKLYGELMARPDDQAPARSKRRARR